MGLRRGFVVCDGRGVAPREPEKRSCFVCVSLLGVLAAALAAESVGLSMALGTFLLGATLSISPFGHPHFRSASANQKSDWPYLRLDATYLKVRDGGPKSAVA
jgi:hypothetical protein